MIKIAALRSVPTIRNRVAGKLQARRAPGIFAILDN